MTPRPSTRHRDLDLPISAYRRDGICVVPWRNFHEINFVNLHYKPFDASTWPPRPSGLLQAPELCPMAAG